jgi:tetratricopeptide (TPR) repeat protein
MVRISLSAVAAVLLMGAAAAGPREDCATPVSPCDPDPRLGCDADQAAKIARVVEACTEVLRSVPNDLVLGQLLRLDNVYLKRGIAYASARNFDQAFADYTRAIEINSGNAFAYLARGIAFSIFASLPGAADHALSDYTKAIEIDPMFAEAYYRRAVHHIGGGNDDLARQDIAKAVAIDPKYVEIIKDAFFEDYLPKDNSPPPGETK